MDNLHTLSQFIWFGHSVMSEKVTQSKRRHMRQESLTQEKENHCLRPFMFINQNLDGTLAETV